ncbi:MAG TPA: hypothetical protein VGI95_09260 [Caulobacteraceae bacterium]|jgi:hypothetical protein
MRAGLGLVALALTVGLGGCVAYHQEVAALRMPRPAGEAALGAYAAPDRDYPSVGGNILAGTSPTAAAAYEATSGDKVPPAPSR